MTLTIRLQLIAMQLISSHLPCRCKILRGRQRRYHPDQHPPLHHHQSLPIPPTVIRPPRTGTTPRLILPSPTSLVRYHLLGHLRPEFSRVLWRVRGPTTMVQRAKYWGYPLKRPPLSPSTSYRIYLGPDRVVRVVVPRHKV